MNLNRETAPSALPDGEYSATVVAADSSVVVGITRAGKAVPEVASVDRDTIVRINVVDADIVRKATSTS